MRQTLFHVPETFFGLPLFGWGLALGLLVLVVILSHVYQYATHRKISDLGSSLGLLAIGGALLVFVIPNLAVPGLGIPIQGYGTLLVVAIFAAFFLVRHLAKRQGIPNEQIYGLCVWTVIVGIICARLFYVVQYWEEMLSFDSRSGELLLRESALNIVNFAQGGLVVFGSILGGILAALVFMLWNKMPVLRTFDSMAPAAALGMAVGRIGCLLNGCCFGGVTDAPWKVYFPPGSPAHVHQIAHGDVFLYGLKFEETTIGGRQVLAIAEVQPNSEAETFGLTPYMLLRNVWLLEDGVLVPYIIQSRRDAARLLSSLQRTMPDEPVQFDFFTPSAPLASYYLTPGTLEVLPVHPTQIYSSILALLLCGTLLLLGRLQFYQRRAGLVLASFMVLYSVGRFCIEFIRTDEGAMFGTGLTISQNVSIVFCLVGIALFVYLCKNESRVCSAG